MTNPLDPVLIILNGTDAADLLDPPVDILAAEVDDITLRNYGLGANDTLTAYSGPADWVAFAANNPDVSLTIANHLYGGGGRDILISSQDLTGLDPSAAYHRADTLEGGAGNDTYIINDVGVTISDGLGTNTAIITAHFQLVSGLTTIGIRGFGPFYTPDIQNLTLQGSADFDILGDPQNNILRGNAGHNYISGVGGDDSLFGGAGDDVLISAEGTSLLDGGAGDDFLRGANGDDTLRGGDGNDALYGDEGNDILIGGRGADRLEGQAGDDTYHVNSRADIVDDYVDSGFDTVASGNLNLAGSRYANIETLVLLGGADLSLTGGGEVVRLTGNAGQNHIHGAAAGETVSGGAGADTLTGGGGADVFAFATSAETASADGRTHDLITDFAQGSDLINLQAMGSLHYIANGSDPVGAASVTSSEDTVTIDGTPTLVTVVAGDLDGDGSWDFRIYLTSSHALTAADFLL